MRGMSLTGGAIALLALLIAVVYFAGLSTDLQAFSAALTSVMYTVTGRDKNGKFAAYPGNAPTIG